MRKLVLVALTITTAFAFAAVAIAQYAVPQITGTLKVTPAKGGTKAKPKNGLITPVFNVNPESESTLSRIEYTIPKNVKLNGAGFPTCTVEKIAAEGDDGCPKKSKVGTGAANALLGPSKTPLVFDVEVYVASKNTLALYLKTSLFNIPIEAQVAGGKVSFDIPARVQSPVSGLYSYVTSVTANLGKQPGIPASISKGKGKKKKTKFFASVVGCTGGQHTGSVKAFLAANPKPPSVPFLDTGAISSPCKK